MTVKEQLQNNKAEIGNLKEQIQSLEKRLGDTITVAKKFEEQTRELREQRLGIFHHLRALRSDAASKPTSADVALHLLFGIDRVMSKIDTSERL